ncbi:MAG: hydroxylamine oxidation protein HaoB [Proteobacteria bacterium]|nr:hydroxylamine oxidation protein HaoB [Pseudomonadota bacterium]
MLTAPAQAAMPARQQAAWKRAIGIVSIATGICFMGGAGLLAWKHAGAPAAYRYELGAALAKDELGALAGLAEQSVVVRRATITAADAQPLAELELAETATGPVLLKWQPRVDDPFLTVATPAQDVAALAQVLQRHLPKDGQVLGWWDTSRQLRLLGGTPVRFDEHLGLPLFVPQRWQAQGAGIEAIERAFWKTGASEEQRTQFRRFANALLSDEASGMAELQAIAGGKPAVLVLHVRDAILLGQLDPRRLGVAFTDLGALSDVHGMVRRVHDWLDHNQYPAYAMLQDRDGPVRAVALTDAASGKTLAARLLPFMGNDQHDVAGATLVYRVGGFVVYELAPQARP